MDLILSIVCISLEMLTLRLFTQVWSLDLSVDQFVSSIIDRVEISHEDAPSERFFLCPPLPQNKVQSYYILTLGKEKNGTSIIVDKIGLSSYFYPY